jgi:hypothetical protein
VRRWRAYPPYLQKILENDRDIFLIGKSFKTDREFSVKSPARAPSFHRSWIRLRNMPKSATFLKNAPGLQSACIQKLLVGLSLFHETNSHSSLGRLIQKLLIPQQLLFKYKSNKEAFTY